VILFFFSKLKLAVDWTNVEQWTADDVREWLTSLGKTYNEYASVFSGEYNS